MNKLSDKECEFVSVLTHSWYSSRTGPIVVHMCHFVGQLLQAIGRQSHIVVQYVIAGGRHSALVDTLRYKEKVISIK